MILLDTSFLIRALVAGSPEDARLRAWLARDAEVTVSAVAWAEFLCGPLDADALALASAVMGEALPATAAHARRAADLFNAVGAPAFLVADVPVRVSPLERVIARSPSLKA